MGTSPILRHLIPMFFLAVVFAGPTWAQGIRVVLDGREVRFDQPPAMIDGRLMVPLRGIFEALNSDVLYSAATRSIKATKGATVVELALGSRQAAIDGRPVYLDVPADTLGGRTMVPLRFVSEALGAEVKWEGASRTVRITDLGGVAIFPPTQPQPPAQPTAKKPVINSIVHSATRDLKEGDIVDVVVTGDPGGVASFEILGATASIPLRESASGRYEGRFVIPRGLTVRQGLLMARLVKDGLEANSESQRTITVSSSGGSSNPPTSGAGQLTVTQLLPPDNSSVNSAQPEIGAQFSQNLLNPSAKMVVDTLDVTAQTLVQGNRVAWTPQYNLDPGRHTVSLVLSENSGAPIRLNWSFIIGGSTTPVGPAPVGGGGLRIQSPANSSSVPPLFRVQGVTFPGATVLLEANYRSISPRNENRSFWGRGIADASGRFDIEMDAEEVTSGLSFTVTISSSKGSDSASQTLQLRRR